MKLNPDKCNLLVSRKKCECNWAKTGDDKIWDSNEVILLGQAIYNEFNFHSQITNICC